MTPISIADAMQAQKTGAISAVGLLEQSLSAIAEFDGDVQAVVPTDT